MIAGYRKADGDEYGSDNYRALILEIIPGDLPAYYPAAKPEITGKQIYETETIIHASNSQLAMLEALVSE